MTVVEGNRGLIRCESSRCISHQEYLLRLYLYCDNGVRRSFLDKEPARLGKHAS